MKEYEVWMTHFFENANFLGKLIVFIFGRLYINEYKNRQAVPGDLSPFLSIYSLPNHLVGPFS